MRVQLKLSRDVRWSVRDTARRSDRYDGDPDLVARDENGEVYIVRYEAVNAMLPNEFLKEHRTVQEQLLATTFLRWPLTWSSVDITRSGNTTTFCVFYWRQVTNFGVFRFLSLAP